MSATERFQQEVDAVLVSTSRVLDLGCGRGGVAERLGAKGWWAGVDPDLASLREHRVTTLPRGSASSEWLPFESGSIDVVIASWVLEHLPRPTSTFREIARVLRPGGSFLFLTPNVAHPLPRISLALARMRRLQQRVVSRVYGRSAVDTFPVTYRANSIRAIECLAVRAGLQLAWVELIDDPSYFVWNAATFWAAIGLELLLPLGQRVHLIGEYRKSGSAGLLTRRQV
ncbi:MAG: class I SAM-dependent methyltransferase [Anaerolineae bacterium]|jgi:SAM-dependent methyltransferase|nr:class I SAM-dependent methyltransferase [Anaerolineae bacterium]